LFKNLSFRWLITLLVTAVSVFSLVAAFAGFLGWEVLRYRSQVVERLDRTQWILVERITAKLAEDPETHEFPLDGLAQDETILAAAVYSLNNQVLDSYIKPGTDEVVPPPFRTNVDPNAAKTTPDQTVVLLNELFSMFDQLVDTYGLEKIKTIGDAYMAVAGVPNAAEDHALRAARMGMAVQDTLKEFNQKNGVNWAVRVGLHSGEVMAGIIGSRKFAYDLWGDTVNLASRLESQGRAGWVQISDETAKLIESEFDVLPVGFVDIRNRGELQVYRIAGPKHPGRK
jgi:hypothetical protein